MKGRWRFDHHTAVLTAALLVIHHLVRRSCCSSLNREGLALLRLRERVVRDPFGALSNWDDGEGGDPCLWFGVECSDGNVVILNLRDLCLEGTLGPELGTLGHIQSLILRNNSLSGGIPNEIGELKELQVLDLGCNNFSGEFPFHFDESLSLTTLLLDNNKFLGGRAITWDTVQDRDMDQERKLQEADTPNPSKTSTPQAFSSLPLTPMPSLPLTPPMPSPFDLPPFFASPPSPPAIESQGPSPATPSTGISQVFPPSPSPSPSHTEALTPSTPPPESTRTPTLVPDSTPTQISKKHSNSKVHKILIWAGVLGGVSIILISAIGLFFFRTTKVDSIKPTATGLSGQLQNAFTSGVPKLNRSELEAACEDFSNIIGSSSDDTIYKGTLSSGVEIAVTSSRVTSPQDWSKSSECQFREKISTLSKVNHKNFMNLIGYCDEDQPFTRMMVFEYAPNGTLFEHLHVAEAEQLEWGTRLRIVMGIAYCLEHMHQLTPPVTHRNLQSSSIYLTEDYAAKISDFSFWNDLVAAKKAPGSNERSNAHSVSPEDNTCSFGAILFEILTGKNPYSVGTDSLAEWICNYQKGKQSLVEMVDPTLTSCQEDKIEKLVGVINDCVDPDPDMRPKMKEVTARLKEITAMGADGAQPRVSPLWWAELEIVSTDGS